MPAVAASRIAAVVVLLRLQVAALAEGSCSAFSFEQNAFPPAVVHRSLSCVDPAVIAPANPSVGHVLLSDLALVTTKQSSGCGQGSSELKAALAPGAASMTLGSSTCALSAITWRRSDSSATTAVDMRLDFVNCSAGPRMASVVMDVVKAPEATAVNSMVPFLREKCSKKTTTPASSLAQVQLNLKEQLVGNGTCDGAVLKSYGKVTQKQCQELCSSEITKYSSSGIAALGSNPEACKGYAFNAASTGDVCHLYKGASVSSLAKKSSPGWFCWNLTAVQSQYSESTPAPPTPEEIAEAEAKLPKLSIPVVATSAEVLTIVSPADKCFQPFSWITLQDAALKTATVQVGASEWAEFLDMLPSPSESAARMLTATQEAAAAAIDRVLIDRAVYGDAGTAPAPVGAPVPVPAPPVGPAPARKATGQATVAKTVVKHEDCVGGEIANAILTSVLVPACTWFAVGFLFHQLFPAGDKGSGNDGDVGVGCSKQTILVLVLCAALVAAIASFIIVAILSVVFMPLCAASKHDVILIKLTSAISAITAICAGLFYLSTKHHAQHVAKGGGDGGGKFMLVKVQGNKNIPVAKSEMYESQAGGSIFLSQS